MEVIEPSLKAGTIAEYEKTFKLKITYPQEPEDPRELSEIPEVRLWFLRLDSVFPWFPFVLDWQSGELSRYVAMIVPHQFNRTEGIIFNPEALELLVMHKIFTLRDWLHHHQITEGLRLKLMGQSLGLDIDDGFFSSFSSY
jgi:hypothetical protein